MDVHKLRRIFNPARIALIGVTPNPKSVGGVVLSNLVGGGFQGVAYPVNPDSEAVLGIPCYPDVRHLPRVPDLGIICSPAEKVPEMVRQCGEAGILGLIIMSAGFREMGEKGLELEAEIRKSVHDFDGMRIIGPNCLGVLVPRLQLNASFASGMPRKGHIAFISQSGALCTSVLDWALEEKIGFSYFVSIGNALDVDFGDLIDYFGQDEETHSIVLYMESVQKARRFMTAARAFARNKPIIVYKAGRFPLSARVAASHTGALASEDRVYDAAFRRIGLARVFDFGDIFDCTELIGRRSIPQGPALAIITNAGGPGVMATDSLVGAGGKLAVLAQDTIRSLDEVLPPFWSKSNPVDVLGDARPKRIAKAIEIVLDDPGVDAVLVILTPQAMTNPTGTATQISQLSENAKKPVLAALLGGAAMHEGIRILNDTGVATYSTPEQAVRAFMTLVDYDKNLKSVYETPKDIPVRFSLDRGAFRKRFDSGLLKQGPVLSEKASKEMLAAYGIPVTMPVSARTLEEAVRNAGRVHYPLVMKIDSPDITHKTDAGGVILGIQDEAALRASFTQMKKEIRRKRPEAKILGVTLQPMASCTHGVEMILGIKKDPVFGSVLMAGMGGIAAELFGDRELSFPPLNENLTRRMLESLKIWPLLAGYRGKPAVDVEKLIEIIMRLSYLAADYPEIEELDINPLLVTPDDVCALDARIVIHPVERSESDPYAHLVLRPYPEEYVRQAMLHDSTPITLRPIKPEDEPLWFDLLRSCSKESIYMRFRYFFHWETHEVASRYCFIDYAREIAIVAEHEQNGKKQLLGVGRLVADPDHENVEFAVLIGDAWQNKGLGSILTDICFEIAKHWGLKRIVAQTTTDNKRMIAVFQKRGFKITLDPHSSLVEVEKELI